VEGVQAGQRKLFFIHDQKCIQPFHGYSFAHAGAPSSNASPNAMLRGHRLLNHQHNRIPPLSARGLGGEVGLELRGVANLSALAVAGIGGPLAASAGGASGLVVLGVGTAAGAVTGGTLVCRVISTYSNS
jgi:hypothetical protein